jgi:hypothetical protein
LPFWSIWANILQRRHSEPLSTAILLCFRERGLVGAPSPVNRRSWLRLQAVCLEWWAYQPNAQSQNKTDAFLNCTWGGVSTIVECWSKNVWATSFWHPYIFSSHLAHQH